MKAQLKPLDQQTIVITGASSGHGLSTARMAAAEGARVMLAARDEEALKQVRDEITAAGGIADYVVTDVSKQEDVERLAQQTIERFGGFDTWVNNAGIGIYGDLIEIPLEDHRAVFETNYWGVVHGSFAAVRHLQDKPGGGALINVGSINSDIPTPVLGPYNASKHAVKGFTGSLRIELMEKEAPVSVTLVKPSAINTPFPQHARNVSGYEATLPSPIYAPEVVARAILHAAQHERRSITVGGAGKFQIAGSRLLPNLFDKIATTMSSQLLNKDKPIGRKPGNLERPQGNDGHAEGEQNGRNFSVFTTASRNSGKVLGGAVALAAAGAVWALTESRRART